jgi:acetyl-CoA carboxylase carboxyltransferase component
MKATFVPQPGLTPPDARERAARESHMRSLVEQLRRLEEQLHQGGGPERIAKQHKAGKLIARERIARLIDPATAFLELGLLVAFDSYDGKAPAAGVVTGLGRVQGRPVAIMANDSTVKAGAWWPETVPKIIRIQQIAMRCRIPIVYLVDSAGINLPFQESIFPGQYGGARIFYNNSLMRRILRVPQIAAVMGQCIAGGAYLPALSDSMIMVEGTSFMGLGGPNLVKGAIGQSVDAEVLGGAAMHTSVSGVAHYKAKDDAECIEMIRHQVGELPSPPAASYPEPTPPLLDEDGLYSVLPADHRLPYDIQEVIFRVFDRDGYLEFMAGYAHEVLCANARLAGRPVGLIANRRGFLRQGKEARIGAIIYTESARKVSQFVEMCDRNGHPLIYLQDVTGFMVGPDAERSGIIRAGAEMVETMACARVPKIVITLSHASGAGYYAMAGQGFDPDFIFSWPTARVGVMEGESAVQALFAVELERLKKAGHPVGEDLQASIERTRADYERSLDAKHCAARGYTDAIIDPRHTRQVLEMGLRAAATARPLICP